ncbi:uncharacterized protein LOC125347150 [Perognathus longimembris pacificus]|uniref:uncharacterized protein LOC125347150 n=1 Tax=Perognathus longimembris pacificus TaxID=214514 RepID=UPI0020192F4F|nr:uncharacterized protein LOC125347150 [Perognathus longimembris pacificus]
MKDGAAAEALGYKGLKTLICKTDGKIQTAVRENQDYVGVENQTPIGEREQKEQKELEDKKPPQAHPRGNQEGLRWKTDAETQTPEWGNQGKSGSEDAVEIQSFQKQEKEARREEKEIQGWTGGDSGKKSKVPQQETQGQAGIDPGAETEAEERRNQDQAGSAGAVQTQTSDGENLGATQQDGDDAEIQTLEWGQHRCVGNEKLTEIQTPLGVKQGGHEEKPENGEQ